MEPVNMVHLTVAPSPFAARVLMARLGTEGIITEVRGFLDGPYPAMGEVEVFVEAAQENWARVLLVAVDEASDEYDDTEEYQHPAWVVRSSDHRSALTRRWLGLAIAGMMLLCLAVVSLSSM
ncbi:MAG: hypothetical protein ACRD0I_00105 [Acidimicrobiales bacterium]